MIYNNGILLLIFFIWQFINKNNDLDTSFGPTIYNTLQSMYEYRITDKDLKREIDGLISILMEDYQSQRDECEEFVTEEDEKEDAALISGDYLDRL